MSIKETRFSWYWKWAGDDDSLHINELLCQCHAHISLFREVLQVCRPQAANPGERRKELNHTWLT